jgi:hypothetical protein
MVTIFIEAIDHPAFYVVNMKTMIYAMATLLAVTSTQAAAKP